jgi:hypothetical protein
MADFPSLRAIQELLKKEVAALIDGFSYPAAPSLFPHCHTFGWLPSATGDHEHLPGIDIEFGMLLP